MYFTRLRRWRRVDVRGVLCISSDGQRIYVYIHMSLQYAIFPFLLHVARKAQSNIPACLKTFHAPVGRRRGWGRGRLWLVQKSGGLWHVQRSGDCFETLAHIPTHTFRSGGREQPEHIHLPYSSLLRHPLALRVRPKLREGRHGERRVRYTTRARAHALALVDLASTPLRFIRVCHVPSSRPVPCQAGLTQLSGAQHAGRPAGGCEHRACHFGWTTLRIEKIFGKGELLVRIQRAGCLLTKWDQKELALQTPGRLSREHLFNSHTHDGFKLPRYSKFFGQGDRPLDAASFSNSRRRCLGCSQQCCSPTG